LPLPFAICHDAFNNMLTSSIFPNILSTTPTFQRNLFFWMPRSPMRRPWHPKKLVASQSSKNRSKERSDEFVVVCVRVLVKTCIVMHCQKYIKATQHCTCTFSNILLHNFNGCAYHSFLARPLFLVNLLVHQKLNLCKQKRKRNAEDDRSLSKRLRSHL